ncbi:MAG TPA: imidazole glycerol phosphate synthase subunit HisH [Actinomycetota bacterium]|nr:imidazole glycerol phosphate synthase subunit HisH [Actinomycetota bacterium]
MNVALVDHGMGNLRSVAKALEAAGARATLTADPEEASRCDALCVPGQGIFGRCMTSLARSGFEALVRGWIADGRPYLGICLGMQVLFESSEEGAAPGLGILGGAVRRLPGDVTVPHIGWNTVGDTYYYFDHSYAAFPADESVVAGWAEHGARFAATVRTGSVLGVQFHPEKSGRDGIALLSEWVEEAA